MKSSLPAILAFSVSVHAANSCGTGYTICAPAGATSTTTPKIGSTEFQSLLSDIVGSSLPSFKRDTADGTASLCCLTSLSCLTLSNLALPFCYDKFTTNFLLPDGSFGTVANGAYTSSSGDTANLLTGDYTLSGGASGNIYAGNEAAKPNTATLALPPQFTGTGVGGAVPVSSLGALVTLTFTTTLPASVVEATTVLPATVPGSTFSSVVTVSTTVSQQIGTTVSVATSVVTTAEVSTAQPSTVAGTTREASTVPAMTRTVVTTQAVAPSSVVESTTAAASASKTGDASKMGGMGLMQGLMMAVLAIFLL
ncbi:hypothetical protein GLAREA_04154 [Glarea lozoyensis ATCC 20868]|uniref:Uncharacterized protein n=1 Tax=Glarea lozoyensis (strain ATCC 20868 / MF5171) TaxID=1116229 RepID=S3CXX1_GLAL2|nr:uncharacterized protein GLAREA_04154 [Glarea lozoyensis ATCC 20868]EPE31187.1 hypothetical protein GLAREA_04154 [Glarea lozoyensis ATCC 20868]